MIKSKPRATAANNLRPCCQALWVGHFSRKIVTPAASFLVFRPITGRMPITPRSFYERTISDLQVNG